MRTWRLGAAMILALAISGCSSNSTTIGVAIVGPSLSPLTVLLGNSVAFTASVSGGSTSTVYWQICLAPTSGTTNPPTKPTNCTAGQGTGAPAVSNPLTGYGTITAGGLYTAPLTMPATNSLEIVATSSVDAKAFGIFKINLDSGIRVHVLPLTATIAPGDTLQFTVTVTGNPTDPTVSWAVTGPTGSQVGSIDNNGLYTAPASSVSVTITATSSQDSTQKGTATVSVSASGPPSLSAKPLDPPVVAQGSVQADIYVNGSNFLSTETVFVNGVAVPTTFISTTLLRATIPATLLAQAGTDLVEVRMENGTVNLGGAVGLEVAPVRPALIASSPDGVSQTNGAVNAAITLTGGYFASGTTSATFNGTASGITIAGTSAATNTRQLNMTIAPPAASNLATPGLYPIVVQNAGIATGQPSMSALNLAVTPTPASIPSAVSSGTSASVGSNPSAVAMDYADGLAVVPNFGDGASAGTVSIVDVTTTPPLLVTTISANIGVGPTGVAVDDLTPHPVALVVNSVDQSISTIDLRTDSVISVLPIPIGSGASSTPCSGATAPNPFSIGINPLTHRAVVAYQCTNEATVLAIDPTTGIPSVVMQIGGGNSGYHTGAFPEVAVDPRLNWAVITPGSISVGGSLALVDLGVTADPNSIEPQGRSPLVVGTVSTTTTMQGVGINPETHVALLADPQSGVLRTLNLMNNTTATVSLPVGAGLGFLAAAASPVQNIGIAVSQGSGSTSPAAEIVDLEAGAVLQTVTGWGTSPQAVAIDPASNRAVVVNKGSNSVTVFNLTSTAIKPLQILESTPDMAPTSASALQMKITGFGFDATSVVLLDGIPITTNSVSANGRQITAMIPTSLPVSGAPPAVINPLQFARRFTVQVANNFGAPNSPVSNVTDLAIIQAIAVGAKPVGVAVDTDRDLAVVTNSGDGTASLVALTLQTPIGPSQLASGFIGPIGPAISVGTTPEGVAVLPRLGKAVIANNGSNNASTLDVTTAVPTTVALCGASCTGPTGVAINPDTATAVVTSRNPASGTNPFPPGGLSEFAIGAISSNSSSIDQDPVAVAVDPTLNYAAVATASQTSSIEIFDMASTFVPVNRITGTSVQNPTGVAFDPVNQVFLAANSLLNTVIIVDPATFVQTQVPVGIAPMSIDYNFQTSTLLTVNPASHTLSLLDYVCPPTIGAPPACAGPRVRTVIGLGGTSTSAPVLGPNAVAIDAKLGLAVLVDSDNNRILLVPLPH